MSVQPRVAAMCAGPSAANVCLPPPTPNTRRAQAQCGLAHGGIWPLAAAACHPRLCHRRRHGRQGWVCGGSGTRGVMARSPPRPDPHTDRACHMRRHPAR